MIITNTTTIEQPEIGLKVVLTQDQLSKHVTLRTEDNGHNTEVCLEIYTWEAVAESLMEMIRRAR